MTRHRVARLRGFACIITLLLFASSFLLVPALALADETHVEGEFQAESAIDECLPEEDALLTSESIDAVIPSDEAEQDISDEPFVAGQVADVGTPALDETNALDALGEVSDESVEHVAQDVAETDGAKDELLVETIEEVDAPAWSDSPNVETGVPAPDAVDDATDEGSNVYRLYNRWTGEHFYTTNLDEARYLVEVGWNWENVGWVAPSSGDDVYRLYNPYAGDHHYTTSVQERDHLVELGWRYENVGWLSAYAGATGTTAVLRQYNPYAKTGTHNFTASTSENDHLASVGWIEEGAAWFSLDKPANTIEGFWLALLGGDRAWVQPDAVMATNRVITPSEGAGIFAYATDSGSVVRGSLDRGDGTTWVADAVTGALPCESGFVRTSAFTGSEEQLYCLVSSGEGYSVAQNGILAGETNNLFAFPDTGAFLFGVRDTGSWVYFSDAETGAFPTTPGWVVTRAYGQGLQRYWLEWGPLGILGARVGYSTAGYAHYTLPGVGYVLRGSGFSTTHYYRANNDGLIVESVKMAFPGKVITQNMGVTLKTMKEWQTFSFSGITVSPAESELDPFTYLGSTSFLQFVDLRSYTGLTGAQINAFISSTSAGSRGVLAGHGQTIVDACRYYNINEAYLVSHMIIETGWGTSYYARTETPNLIGWAAYDTNPDECQAYASNNGWTSVDGSIWGAAKVLVENYICTESTSRSAQPTLYEMRWSAADSVRYGQRYWHQYCTDTQWPSSIARTMGALYQSAGVSPNLTYVVPMYS